MSIQAILIDAENVSCTLAHSIMAEAKKQGTLTQPYVYGRKEAVKGWQVAISQYSMQVRTHEGGKDAADHLLLQDAHALFEHQGVRTFYLVSNDGGFAPHIRLLCGAGCEVTVIGNDHAAKRLKEAGTHFVSITKKSGINQSSVSSAEKEKGPCSMSENWLPTADLAEDPWETGTVKKKQAALNELYGSTFPRYLFTMLNLVLEQCFRDLCLEKKDVFTDVHEPQEVEEVLETLKHDPVFESILALKELAAPWDQMLLFARRCHTAYQQGWEAAKGAFTTLPVIDARNSLFEQQRQRAVERWRPSFRYELNIYPPGYSEETERDVMRRWYQQGYAAQTQEYGITHHSVWNSFDAVPIENGQQSALPDPIQGM